MPNSVESSPRVRVSPQEYGHTAVEVLVEDDAVSKLAIIPLVARIGVAHLPMDGIGDVRTFDQYQRRGYARILLEATIEHMRQGPAALSTLYGIRNFYPKFGFATAGPEYIWQLHDLTEPAPLPDGWTCRRVEARDVPEIHRLYATYTAQSVGACERDPSGFVWTKLATLTDSSPGASSHDDECRVLLSPAGRIEGYIWRAPWCWPVHVLERERPESLVLGEVIANTPMAAAATLAVCRAWGVEEAAARPTAVKEVIIGLPPEGSVATAAMRQHATLSQHYLPDGDFMARVVDATRLFQHLAPELSRRVQTARAPHIGPLCVQSEGQEALLRITADGVAISRDATESGPIETVSLPQTDLARLAFGTFPPTDILDRLPRPPSDHARDVLELLFPVRHPFIHFPDRF